MGKCKCQVGDRNVSDVEANRNKYCAIILSHQEILVSAAVTSTAPKLPDIACEKTVIEVRTRELSFHTWAIPVLDSSSINKALEATDLQPLSQDNVENHIARKEACELSLKAALSREFLSTR